MHLRFYLITQDLGHFGTKQEAALGLIHTLFANEGEMRRQGLPQLANPDIMKCLRGQHRHRPCLFMSPANLEHDGQFRLHAIRSVAIGLVDHKDIGNLQNPRLHGLDGIA